MMGPKIATCVLLVALSAGGLSAQSARRLEWEMATPAGTTPLATVNGYVYKLFVDGATTGVIVTGVVCVAAVAPLVGFTCSAPLGAYTAGDHEVTLTAGDSPPSAALTFRFYATATPTNLRLRPEP